ncbi:conserved hypothetical protein [Ricinus communis]|uniref:Uncharacterized protein n=1 Tax=Ricinus communis TaxID=3988 RepID=B9RXL8_RICCO|nr:conserved hypothetical protein [Ricinus communis]
MGPYSTHPRKSNEGYYFNHRMKLLEDQIPSVSVASCIRAETLQAQLRMHELEAEVRSFQKQNKSLLRKLGEKRTL